MADQTQPTPQQRLSQERAQQAWAAITANEVSKFEGKYATLTQKLSTMIYTNGLGPTVAFLLAKAKGKPFAESHHKLLYDQLSAWVSRKVYLGGDLLDNIINNSSIDLRRATHEAIEFAIWLRRFSEAKFGEHKDDDENG